MPVRITSSAKLWTRWMSAGAILVGIGETDVLTGHAPREWDVPLHATNMGCSMAAGYFAANAVSRMVQHSRWGESAVKARGAMAAAGGLAAAALNALVELKTGVGVSVLGSERSGVADTYDFIYGVISGMAAGAYGCRVAELPDQPKPESALQQRI